MRIGQIGCGTQITSCGGQDVAHQAEQANDCDYARGSMRQGPLPLHLLGGQERPAGVWSLFGNKKKDEPSAAGSVVREAGRLVENIGFGIASLLDGGNDKLDEALAGPKAEQWIKQINEAIPQMQDELDAREGKIRAKERELKRLEGEHGGIQTRFDEAKAKGNEAAGKVLWRELKDKEVEINRIKGQLEGDGTEENPGMRKKFEASKERFETVKRKLEDRKAKIENRLDDLEASKVDGSQSDKIEAHLGNGADDMLKKLERKMDETVGTAQVRDRRLNNDDDMVLGQMDRQREDDEFAKAFGKK